MRPRKKPSLLCTELESKQFFFWPADREPLIRTIFRISGKRKTRGRKQEPHEVALEELVTSHLRADSTPFGSNLRAKAVKRYVTLFGRVDALWKVHVAEQVASEVPGVKEVYADGICVSGSSGLSDREIAIAARQVLKHTAGVDESTLVVSVKDGTAALSGTASSRSELARSKDLIAHVRGVEEVQNWAVVSERGKRNDRQVAQTVRDAVYLRFPKSKVDVAVFDGVAVLSGAAKTSGDRRKVAALVDRQKRCSARRGQVESNRSSLRF